MGLSIYVKKPINVLFIIEIIFTVKVTNLGGLLHACRRQGELVIKTRENLEFIRKKNPHQFIDHPTVSHYKAKAVHSLERRRSKLSASLADTLDSKWR